MRPAFEPDHRCVRVAIAGVPHWGRLDGDAIVLDGGERIPEAEASYLAPVDPTKIIAVHLTFGSRIVEMAMATPPEPAYFAKLPSGLNGHRGVIRRPAGAQYLKYEG